jgi:hypothetical protein
VRFSCEKDKNLPQIGQTLNLNPEISNCHKKEKKRKERQGSGEEARDKGLSMVTMVGVHLAS